MMFGKQVDPLPIMLISVESISHARKGIKRRINRERNWMYLSDDPDYIKKRKDNIARLQIIRNELKKLEKQL